MPPLYHARPRAATPRRCKNAPPRAIMAVSFFDEEAVFMRTTLRFSSLDPVVRTTLNLPYCTVPDFYGGGAQALHMHVV